MIPRIIHYCWFGGSPLPEPAVKCIASWKKHCPDYEIVRWDETNFDLTGNSYAREAYGAKKWAFVTDYARLHVIHARGGIYMDTDVELLRPLDRFLEHRAFSGFESNASVPTGIMAGEAGSAWFKLLLDYYSGRHFVLPDGRHDTTTNLTVITRLTKEHYGIRLDNTFQDLGGEVAFYPSDWFCPKSFRTGIIKITENTHAIHHFAGSWLAGEDVLHLERQRKIVSVMGDNVLSRCVLYAMDAAKRFGKRIREKGLPETVRYYCRKIISPPSSPPPPPVK